MPTFTITYDKQQQQQPKHTLKHRANDKNTIIIYTCCWAQTQNDWTKRKKKYRRKIERERMNERQQTKKKCRKIAVQTNFSTVNHRLQSLFQDSITNTKCTCYFSVVVRSKMQWSSVAYFDMSTITWTFVAFGWLLMLLLVVKSLSDFVDVIGWKRCSYLKSWTWHIGQKLLIHMYILYACLFRWRTKFWFSS